MAENIAFKITVDTDVADLSVGELKQAFKDLTTELNTTQAGTEKYKQTLTKLGDVKGALKDVKEQIIALDPEKKFRAIANIGSSIASGFAAAQGAVALFGGESEDLQKVLVRVQAATALASGLQGLAGFGKALQTASLAMQAFALSNPFTAIAAGVVALTVALVALVTVIQNQNKESVKLQKTYDDLVKSTDARIAQLENELIAIGNVAGKEEEALKIKKEIIQLSIKQAEASIHIADAKRKEAIEEENWITILEKLVSPAFATYRRKQRVKEADEEVAIQKAKLDKLKAQLTAANTDITNLQTKQSEENKKLLDDLTPIQLVGGPEDDAMFIIPEDIEGRIERANEAIISGLEDLSSQSSTIRQKNLKEVLEAADKEEERYRALMESRVQIARGGVELLGQISKLYAGLSEKDQKRAFEINKAASLAGAIIDTYAAANGAYKSQMSVPSPDAPVRAAIAAGLAITTGLARVAVIAKTKFESKSAPESGGSVSTPNLQSPQTSNNVNANGTNVNTNGNGDFTSFDKPIKAYVVESEVTSSQRTIKSIQERTTF